MSKNDEEINAVEEINKEIEGENGAADLGGDKKPSVKGSKFILIIIIAIACVIAAVMIHKSQKVKKSAEENSEKSARARSEVRPVVPTLVRSEISSTSSDSAEQKVTTSAGSTSNGNASTDGQDSENISPAEAARIRRMSSPLESDGNSSGQSDSSSTSRESAARETGRRGSSSNELSDRLQPMKLAASKASTLANRDLLITKGAMIDCLLETKIISTQMGMVSCYTTRDIYSSSGRVVLLDKGTKVTGFYQGGIAQGQARIFVVWNEAETPSGVTIPLESPGTGALGEAGLGGYVDNHFWDRFGGAVMVSMIGDLGQWVSNQSNNKNNGTSIQLDGTSDGMKDVVVEVLKNSINIPPTLTKFQGERVSIFVSRNLDFGDVYELKPY